MVYALGATGQGAGDRLRAPPVKAVRLRYTGRAQIAGRKADSAESRVRTLTDTLRKAIDQAKDVQEELGSSVSEPWGCTAQ